MSKSTEQHWEVTTTSWRPEKKAKLVALTYNPTPGGKKHKDGSTSYSLIIPAMVMTDWVSEPVKSAEGIARELNAFPDMLKALEDAHKFIAQALSGEFVAAEARPVFAAIGNAISKATGQ